MSIYYVPIGSETYSPITAENIANHVKPCTADSRQAAAIDDIVVAAGDGGSVRFLDKAVRAKIMPLAADAAAAIFVDNDGGLRVAGTVRSLSQSDLPRLKSALERACASQWRAEAEAEARAAAADEAASKSRKDSSIPR